MKFIGKYGYCDDFAMPLIGTANAAIRDATVEKVVEYIANQFVDLQERITRSLTICIGSKDYLEDKIDLKRIKRHIEYRCGGKRNEQGKMHAENCSLYQNS